MFTTEENNIIAQAISILEKSLKIEGTAFASNEEAERFCRLQIGAKESEVFAALWLNSQHQLIQFEILFKGTVDASAVYPREVVKGALKHNAAAVIFTHNHPSGITVPSQADRHITQTLKDTLAVIDVRVLDHIVVSKSDTTSFAESGLL